MSFLTSAQNHNNSRTTTTTNGMTANRTTGSSLTDLFGSIASSRGTPQYAKFAAALEEDEDKALRILLWTRDILKGAGERKQFRDLMSYLDTNHPEIASKLIHKIPELGRWDDLFVFQKPSNVEKAMTLYGQALSEGNQLAAKWAPREKSSKRSDAYKLRKHLKLKPKEYRKLLVRNTDVVETNMCANNWDNINYSHVPSIAAFRYQKAFGKHSPTKYNLYLEALQKGDSPKSVKVNAGALYPHDIVKSLLRGDGVIATEQWKNLTNFCDDTRIMPMVDVSGSMGSLHPSSSHGRNSPLTPAVVAVSLGLYLSEKNTSSFKDLFMTFSSRPEFVHLKGDINSRLRQMATSSWGMNTNISAAFDSILSLAIQYNLPEEDMPEYLLILSDMQFDVCASSGYNPSAVQMIRSKYAMAGYKVPKIIFWNLAATTSNSPVKFGQEGTALVSGFSPSILTSILSGNLDNFSSENVMLETIMSSRYDYL